MDYLKSSQKMSYPLTLDQCYNLEFNKLYVPEEDNFLSVDEPFIPKSELSKYVIGCDPYINYDKLYEKNKSIPEYYTVLLKPSYKAKDGTIKEAIIIDNNKDNVRWVAPKDDLYSDEPIISWQPASNDNEKPFYNIEATKKLIDKYEGMSVLEMQKNGFFPPRAMELCKCGDIADYYYNGKDYCHDCIDKNL